MTASWRAMMTSWRLPKWPRRFAYPAGGPAAVGRAWSPGCSPLEASTSRHVPTISWIFAELRARPLAVRVPAGRDAGDDDDPRMDRRAQGGPARAAVDDRSADGPRQPAPPARRVRRRAQSRGALRDAARRCCWSISTGSRTSTTATDTATAIGRCSSSRRRCAGRCRATDLAARYGGDEFVVLAVNTPATEARVLALRIRDSVRRLEPARRALVEDQRADQPHRVDRRGRPEGGGAADLRRAARGRRSGALRGEGGRPRRRDGRAAAPAPAEADPRRGRRAPATRRPIAVLTRPDDL